MGWTLRAARTVIIPVVFYVAASMPLLFMSMILGAPVLSRLNASPLWMMRPLAHTSPPPFPHQQQYHQLQ
jgi:hypothetical protein